MRKLTLVLAGLFASYNCFAELGQISVKSYLEQPLYATIPIYNVADGNYNNVVINLATVDKFKNYGIEYNSDLGALQFKIINQGTSHYLQITSSRSISAPVLNLLLHYQENNNDFYRQYTILLNPIQYGANGYASTTAVNQAGGRSNPIPVGKYSANSNLKASKVAKNPNRKYTGVYAQSFVNPFVKSHLSQFNADDMTFNMKAGDTLYIPARFVQLMYPRAGFPINQVIMAMGLANYHDLRDQNYIYESGETINLPEPAKIAAIPVALADEYVWRSTNNTEDRLNLLSQLAKKFDSSIEISGDPTLFNQNGSPSKIAKAGKANGSGVIAKSSSSMPVNASAPAKRMPITQPIQYEEPSLIDQVLDFKLEIAGGLVVLAGLGLLLKRRKPKVKDDGDKPTKKEKKKKSKLDDSLSELHGESVQLQAPKKIADQVQEQKKQATAPSEVKPFGNPHTKPTVNVAKPLDTSNTKPVVNNIDTPLEFNSSAKSESRVETFAYDFNKTSAVSPEILSPQPEQILSDTTFGMKTQPEPELVPEIPVTQLETESVVVPVANETVAPVIEEPIKSVLADEVIHDDVIDTLEQILSIDKSRNDIRLKLFELYLAHGATSRASRYYDELNEMVDFDDPLRTNMSHIASKYEFKTTSSESFSVAATDYQPASSSEPLVNAVNHEEEITPDNLMDFAKTGTLEEDNYSVEFKPTTPSIVEEQNSLVFETPSINPQSQAMTEALSPTVSVTEAPDLNSNNSQGGFAHREGFVAEVLDKDVTETLEQILSFDETRNDIRLKLFEMYSAADMYVPACKYFVELDEILDFDDPLRATLNELVYKFGFKEGASSDVETLHTAAPDVLSISEINGDDNALQFSSASSVLLNNAADDANLLDSSGDEEYVMEFNHASLLEEIAFAGSDASSASEPELQAVAATPTMSIEQQINLATMYCQIDEQAKALALLKEVINSPVAAFEQKDAAMKLILEHKLHG